MARNKKATTIGVVPARAQQVQEIMRCGTDASYFISKYVKISHPVKGPLPFRTYPYQDRCLKAFQTNRFVITNKSRQLGLSTLSAAYSLWMALFQREKNILVIATRLEVAKNFLKKVNGMYDSLPKWLVMPQITSRSVKYITFSNGSKIQAVPTGTDAGRSEALSLLIIDEAAHVEGIDDLWLGLRPTLSTGGNCILISSPSGVGTLFHKLWVGAKKGEDGTGQPNPGVGTNEFYRVELPWTVHPEHDQAWFEAERLEILPAKGERGVAQELLCSFAASGDNFISGDVLEKLEKNCKAPISTYGHRGDVWVWVDPQPTHRYIISADVSRGDAEDFSAFHVIDTTKDEVVCEFQGKVPPEELANLMTDIGLRYNKALLCPELNSFGLLTSSALKKSGYPNLFYERIAKNMYSAYTTADVQDDIPGFTTGPKNRDEILAKLENVLRTSRLKIYSMRMVNELKTFVWKNNKAQAMKGYNDDLVISLAIGNSLYEAAGINAWDSTEVTAAMLAGISMGQKKMNSIGTSFGKENKFVPPIMTSSGIKEYANAEHLKVKQEEKRQGALGQDFRSPWWKQFKWVSD
ncbi:MAG: terminase family protein [Candidatus Paceibacterota bacterium]|jgi:hypothetical protein